MSLCTCMTCVSPCFVDGHADFARRVRNLGGTCERSWWPAVRTLAVNYAQALYDSHVTPGAPLSTHDALGQLAVGAQFAADGHELRPPPKKVRVTPLGDVVDF